MKINMLAFAPFFPLGNVTLRNQFLLKSGTMKSLLKLNVKRYIFIHILVLCVINKHY